MCDMWHACVCMLVEMKNKTNKRSKECKGMNSSPHQQSYYRHAKKLDKQANTIENTNNNSQNQNNAVV